MKARKFLNQVDHERVVRAIREAESKTSGQLRVFVSRSPAEDPVAAATARFKRLGMTKTTHRNAVLIFVAPTSHTFAVIGDKAVHEKCTQAFWDLLAGEMKGFFKAGDFTGGLVKGIEAAGKSLAEHFPRGNDDKNELPDKVEEG